jgi:two-component system LytT family response regulator
MLRAIIIDDELYSVRYLQLLIKKAAPGLAIVASSTNPHLGKEFIETLRPDIVFLDIHMPVMNGFELLESLNYRNFYLVFTTAHAEYGLRALKQNATDYLLKPIRDEDLAMAVKHIEKKVKEKEETLDIKKRLLDEMTALRDLKVPLPGRKAIEYIAPREILYLEAEYNNTKIMLTSLISVNAAKPMKDYEHLLCREELSFMRIHNSYIININYVTRYLKEDGGYVVLPDNKTIPVSRHKKEEFLKAINFKQDA